MHKRRLPSIDALYWALIVSSTTLGETSGDLISQTLGLGYGGGTAVLLGLFAVAMAVEVSMRRSHAWLYWTTLTLASIGGTTLSDFAARTLGLGYPASTIAIACTLALSLGAWRSLARSLDLQAELDTRGEALYWMSILTSSTLGTALGDLLSKAELDLDGGNLADTACGGWMSSHQLPLAGFGLGDGVTTAVLVGLLVAVTVVALGTRVSRTGCYWAGIIVTHPLGAAMGDFMTKEDGMHLGNAWSTAILAAVLAVIAVFAWRRAHSLNPTSDSPPRAAS